MGFENPKIVDIDLLDRLQRLNDMIFNDGKVYKCDEHVDHRRDMENMVSTLLYDISQSPDYAPRSILVR